MNPGRAFQVRDAFQQTGIGELRKSIAADSRNIRRARSELLGSRQQPIGILADHHQIFADHEHAAFLQLEPVPEIHNLRPELLRAALPPT